MSQQTQAQTQEEYNRDLFFEYLFLRRNYRPLTIRRLYKWFTVDQMEECERCHRLDIGIPDSFISEGGLCDEAEEYKKIERLLKGLKRHNSWVSNLRECYIWMSSQEIEICEEFVKTKPSHRKLRQQGIPKHIHKIVDKAQKLDTRYMALTRPKHSQGGKAYLYYKWMTNDEILTCEKSDSPNLNRTHRGQLQQQVEKILNQARYRSTEMEDWRVDSLIDVDHTLLHKMAEEQGETLYSKTPFSHEGDDY